MTEKHRKRLKRLKAFWYKTRLSDFPADSSNLSLGELGKSLKAFSVTIVNGAQYFYTKPFYYRHCKYFGY